jgi:isopenicillin N synthase-like dioxygenase
LDIHKSNNFKGYTALLGENTNPENRGDLHEGFDIGWPGDSPHATTSSEEMSGVNVWPDEKNLPNFKKHVLDY